MQGSTQGALSPFPPQEFRRTAAVRAAHAAKAIAAAFQTSKNNRGRRLQPTLAAAAPPVRALHPPDSTPDTGETTWIDESIDRSGRFLLRSYLSRLTNSWEKESARA